MRTDLKTMGGSLQVLASRITKHCFFIDSQDASSFNFASRGILVSELIYIFAGGDFSDSTQITALDPVRITVAGSILSVRRHIGDFFLFLSLRLYAFLFPSSFEACSLHRTNFLQIGKGKGKNAATR